MLIMIMAGGTGGHIYPALAVAKVLQQDNCEVIWLGSKQGMENIIVPKHDINIENINIKGLRHNGSIGWLIAPIKILIAMKQSFKILRKHKPDVVLGMGGFVSGPGAIAARLLSIPLVIHEQNAVAGLTNKLLNRFATKTLEAFPGTLENAQIVGNPVRSDIEALSLKNIENPLNILVLGGSLGAKIFNNTMPEVLEKLKNKINIWHQTGQNKLTDTLAQYRGITKAKVVEFIDDMQSALLWADVVICRSGATTIFELSASGRAALLVPYPYAVDDHQTKNAQFLVKNKAAILVNQDDFNAEFLSNIIENWLDNNDELTQMSQNAKKCYLKNSAQQVANICLELVS